MTERAVEIRRLTREAILSVLRETAAGETEAVLKVWEGLGCDELDAEVLRIINLIENAEEVGEAVRRLKNS